MNEENLLPSSVLSKASLRGNEYAWPLEHVKEAILAAKERHLATIGGQAQFRLPDSTCEMYWLNADASERRSGESWEDYVVRSAEEVIGIFDTVRTGTDFLEEARKFPFLQDKIKAGVAVLDYLCFVLYFNAEESFSG